MVDRFLMAYISTGIPDFPNGSFYCFSESPTMEGGQTL